MGGSTAGAGSGVTAGAEASGAVAGAAAGAGVGVGVVASTGDGVASEGVSSELQPVIKAKDRVIPARAVMDFEKNVTDGLLR